MKPGMYWKQEANEFLHVVEMTDETLDRMQVARASLGVDYILRHQVTGPNAKVAQEQWLKDHGLVLNPLVPAVTHIERVEENSSYQVVYIQRCVPPTDWFVRCPEWHLGSYGPEQCGESAIMEGSMWWEHDDFHQSLHYNFGSPKEIEEAKDALRAEADSD